MGETTADGLIALVEKLDAEVAGLRTLLRGKDAEYKEWLRPISDTLFEALGSLSALAHIDTFDHDDPNWIKKEAQNTIEHVKAALTQLKEAGDATHD